MKRPFDHSPDSPQPKNRHPILKSNSHSAQPLRGTALESHGGLWEGVTSSALAGFKRFDPVSDQADYDVPNTLIKRRLKRKLSGLL